jgi:hypothetical protein
LAPQSRIALVAAPAVGGSSHIPPPINNPSAQIMQFNHSFSLDGGLGNNPTNHDAYIRYNLTW